MFDRLRSLCAAGLSPRQETELISWHQRHFRRRAERLDPSFFPGRETGSEAIESLGGGAYAWFRNGEFRDGLGAFCHAVAKNHNPPTGFLYYWRGSATIQFLRREASGLLAQRRKLQRNLRLALQSGFRSATSGRETRWSLPEWSSGAPHRGASAEAVPLDQIRVDVGTLRGRALVRAVLEAAGRPLTLAELGAIVERSHEFVDERPEADPDQPTPDPDAVDPERAVLRGELEARIRSLYDRLDEPTRRVLIARRFAEPDRSAPSFRDVAPWVGRGHETCRKLELRFREAMRRLVDGDERTEAASILAELMRTDPLAESLDVPPERSSPTEGEAGPTP